MNDITRASLTIDVYKLIQRKKDPLLQARLYNMVFQYAFENIEPDEESDLFDYFLLVQSKIDYEIKAKTSGKKGGLKKAENRNNFFTSAQDPTIGFSEPYVTNENVNVNVNVNENERENENEQSPHSQQPLSFSSPEQEYSKNIFKIFSTAGCPCQNNNPLTFLQKDFKDGLEILHRTPGLQNLHSDDVIQACKNYTSVLLDDKMYVTNRYSFPKFLQTKNFTDYLPQNFVRENFILYDQKKQPQNTGQPQTQTPPEISFEDARQEFLIKMQNDPRFIKPIFCHFAAIWDSCSRPKGEEYFRWQNEMIKDDWSQNYLKMQT
ncbi:hypothetical protein [Treponema berlinense]|uniref:hypothetical protein n=1 Tax=Treponema berlinense TaxID=225004 RepID=UPI003FD7B89A